jgi:uncharacterized membrane protein YecN with MAPEG domain
MLLLRVSPLSLLLKLKLVLSIISHCNLANKVDVFYECVKQTQDKSRAAGLSATHAIYVIRSILEHKTE